jgi:hypothetical protein
MEAVRTSETSVDNYFTRQYIPEDNSEQQKFIYFQKFVILLKNKYGYLLSQTVNTDEIPIWFNTPKLTNIEHRGERSD